MRERNFKAKVSYLGEAFHGFGIQKKVVTVQGEIEKAIKKVVHKKVRIAPAGRTDAGVHAAGQVISFKVKTKLSPKVLLKAINAHLPDNIWLLDLEEAAHGFHARYCAKARTYVYNILEGASCPLHLVPLVWHLRAKLNLAAMRKAAKLLIGKHDFSSFSIVEGKNRSYVRQMIRVQVKARAVHTYVGTDDVLKVRLISLTFKANAFTRGMIRGIVGTLVRVGQGKLIPREFKKILQARDRRQAAMSAPGKGLSLVKVDY